MPKFNKEVELFLYTNKVDVKSLYKNSDAMIFNNGRINPIVARWGMYKDKIKKKICVGDIIGKKLGISQNILDEMNDIFNTKGEYYKRSLSMLEYGPEEIIQNLEDSFKIQPITVSQIKNDKYCINDNGMHRYVILKVHYLNELNKCDKDGIKDIQRKYTIPVLLEKIDVIKTYSKCILQNINRFIEIQDELDEKFQKTGNVLYIDEDRGEELICDDKMLLEKVKENIKGKEINKNLSKMMNHDEEFKNFLSTYHLSD